MPPARVLLILVCSLAGADELQKAQQLYGERCFAEAKSSALASPDSAEAKILLAKICLESGELNDSIDWLSKAAAQQPGNPEIYRILGLDYALGGMKKEAVAAFRQAASLRPDNWEYRYLEGRALYEMDRFPEARAAFDQALRLNPAAARVWTALGQLQEKTQDRAAAEASYRKAVAGCQGKECAWPLLELALVAQRTAGEPPEALLRRAIAARPDWAKPHFYLGKELAAREQYGPAREEFETAVRLDANRSEYFYQLARACRQMGDEAASRRYMARFREMFEAEKRNNAVEVTLP